MIGDTNGLILIIPVIIFVGLVLKRLNKSIKKWSLIRIDDNEKIINYNFNLINGIKEILIFGNIKETLDQFNNSLKNLEDVDVKNGVVTSYPKVLLEQSVILIFIAIILLMSYFEKTNDDIIIMLTFYLAAAYRLVPSINKIFVSYQQIKFGKPSIPTIMEYYKLKQINQFLERPASAATMEFKKKINLKNIRFRYTKEKEIINDLNLEILKKEIIGISGESGAGKSTIINLVTSLIKPLKGDLIVDGKKISDPIDLRKYKNLFTLTSQDTYLIDGTIKDNIVIGSTNQTSDKMLNFAINFAGLRKMINNLPKGVNTNIGSSIKQLSSGQKQRISIARSVYADREVLIFDEATNALDEKNERIIFENIKKLKNKKTIIIISHNIKNLKICDKIYKVTNNKLVPSYIKDLIY
jgi:ABC-type multidrug transport system fused ATPase/permease subunit